MSEKKIFRKTAAMAAIIAFLCMTFAGCSITDPNWILSAKKQSQAMDEKAVTRFIQNMRARPENPDSHYLLANYYHERGKYWEAVTEFNKALAINPYHVKAYNGRGMSLDQLGEHEKAVESYRMALRLDPKLDYVLNNLCYSLALQGNAEEAIQACKQSLLLNAKNSRIRNNLAMAYAIGGDYDQAFIEFETAANGDKVSAHLKLAAVCLERAKFQLAADHFWLALSLNPLSNEAKKGLEASRDLMKIADLANQYQKAGEAGVPLATTRNGVEATTHFLAAQTLYKKSAFREAQEEYRQAVALNPEHVEARRELIAAEALARISTAPSRKEMTEKVSVSDIKKFLAGSSPENAGIEVCNGNGQSYMARDITTYLRSRGFKVVRITNARSFNNKGGGVIYYKNEYKDTAVNVAANIQEITKLQPVENLGNPRVYVKVILGKDLIAHQQTYRKIERKS